MPLTASERENIQTRRRVPLHPLMKYTGTINWLAGLVDRLDAEARNLLVELETAKAEIDHLHGALDHEDSRNRAIVESVTHMDAGRRERSED